MNAASQLSERYRKVHRTGQDCRLTNVRNHLELHGHRLSYAIVQGLASSLHFAYRTQFSGLDRLTFPIGRGSDAYVTVAGQRIELVENLAFQFNATLLTGEPANDADAEEGLLAFLDEGVPVMVATSREVIGNYLGQPVRLPGFMGDARFGGHYVTVTEVDRARRMATLFDTDRMAAIHMPLEVLGQARCFGDADVHCLMPSKRRWMVFRPAAKVPTSASQMRFALEKVVTNFRSAELNHDCHSGIPGLRAFCEELPHWTERPDMCADRLRATIFLLRLLSDEVSGGSLGRRTFGIFLRRAGDVLRLPWLFEAAYHYSELTSLWKELMRTLEERVFAPAQPCTLDIPAIRGLLARILSHEERGLVVLERGLELAA